MRVAYLRFAPLFWAAWRVFVCEVTTGQVRFRAGRVGPRVAAFVILTQLRLCLRNMLQYIHADS